MDTYQDVLQKGRAILEGAGFSQAEINWFQQKYDLLRHNGTPVEVIQKNISDSANARVTRRLNLERKYGSPEEFTDNDYDAFALLSFITGTASSIGLIGAAGLTKLVSDSETIPNNLISLGALSFCAGLAGSFYFGLVAGHSQD